ncbi:MAG TPA: tetratricopeptide repeat protein [Tepidisphaeraceae bacterium]|nr:tetratricopeptide repeat protein [Tepidisphaeraceae bacterium]
MDATPSTHTPTFRWFPEGLIVLFLLAGTIGLYARVVHFDFVEYDDPDYVSDNKHVAIGLTPGSIIWAFTTNTSSNWHPVTWLSILLDVSLFGINAAAIHLENVLIHAVNAVLLFILLLKLTSEPWPSAWVAAMFAWHPLHVESVAWIAERKDALSTFFLFLCFLAYYRYVHKQTGRAYITVLFWLFLALLSKPMVVTAPCLMLLMDVWPLKRILNPELAPPRKLGHSPIGRLVVEKLPMFVLVAFSSFATYIAQSTGGSVGSLRGLSIPARISNAIVSYATYLRMMVYPRGLAIFYPHPAYLPGSHISIQALIVASIVLTAITVIAIVLARKMPWLLVGWLWFLGALVPAIGLVQVGMQAMADRYSYVPLVGIFIAIAWTSEKFLRKSGRAVGAALLIPIVIVCWHQIETWRNTQTVMEHAIAVVPNNYVAHASLGKVFDGQGRTEDARHEYEEALRIKPDDPLSFYNLAFQYQLKDDLPAAIDLYYKAILADPTYTAAFNNYGNLLMRVNRTADAEQAYRIGIARGGKDYPQLYHNYAILLAQQKQYDEAIKLWQTAVTLDPTYAAAHFRLGQALIIEKRLKEGIDELKMAARLEPGSVEMLTNLAWILATHPNPAFQDGPLAADLASTAVELTHNTNPGPLDVLAAADARIGQFQQAVQFATRAADLAGRQGKLDLAKAIRQRLELYENRQPYSAGQTPTTEPSEAGGNPH